MYTGPHTTACSTKGRQTDPEAKIPRDGGHTNRFRGQLAGQFRVERLERRLLYGADGESSDVNEIALQRVLQQVMADIEDGDDDCCMCDNKEKEDDECSSVCMSRWCADVPAYRMATRKS